MYNVKSLDKSIPSTNLQVPFVSNTAMNDAPSSLPSSCTITTTKKIKESSSENTKTVTGKRKGRGKKTERIKLSVCGRSILSC